MIFIGYNHIGYGFDGLEEEGLAEDARLALESKVPAHILTGFLGSGKTTLLNHVLREAHGRRFAVIENEFGEVGIDDALIARREELGEQQIIEMNNGCICCTARELSVDEVYRCYIML